MITFKKLFSQSAAGVLLLLVCGGCYHVWKPLPAGLNHHGQPFPSETIQFLTDVTYVDSAGERRLEQDIFDSLFAMIDQAEKLILVDMFLFNEFTGESGPPHRRLCEELTAALIARKTAVPSLRIIVITDPVNTVYGGLEASHLTRLETAGVDVVMTDLDRLRDSNPLWSSPWRLLVKPFGDAKGKGTVKSPFGEEKVSRRSWLKMINFKANHRKVAVMDSGAGLSAWVSSANPHDGSSAHGNVALVFDGPAAMDILKTEEAVLAYTSPETPLPSQRLGLLPGSAPAAEDTLRIQVLTEGAIGRAADQMIDTAKPGDTLDMVMFYVADRSIVSRLKQAAERGVAMRIILDPNKDAFGRTKKGLPNRQTGGELVKAGIPVRWADTHGEQSHAKLLMINHADGTSDMLLGSANLTRRNLRNYNLETNVLFSGPTESCPATAANRYVARLWNNDDGKSFTTDFDTYRDDSIWKKIRCHIQEKTGLCTW
ncbi:MAG: phospholipase D-like domain-containing protein [Lentisphaeria bacterium]|nr:phospholipase D-like domain-containing protein [Lentisphaeria bacterium]